MPRRKKIEEPIEEVKKIKTPPLIRGMKDTLPGEQKYWRLIVETAEQVARDFSFSFIDTPVLGKYDLFAHTMGKNSELVRQDVMWFLDKGEKLALRPDFTPSVARAYVDHSLFNQPAPNKFWYSGKIYSQGKVTGDKNREQQQFGFEVYGEKSASVDSELVVMMYETLASLGLRPKVKVNSLGCLSCRGEYFKALSGFIKSKRSAVCAECRTEATKNPLRFLNCANPKCQKILEDAPQVVDYLCADCHAHLFKFLETLDELKIEYVLDGSLLKDVSYYTGTVYNIYNQKEDGTLGSLLVEGGRFNYLTEMLGGPNTPAAGIKFIVEKLMNELREEKVEVPAGHAPHVYLAQLSEQAKRRALSFVSELRREDFRVVANFSKDNLKSQLDSATKRGAKIVLIMGQREVVDGTVLMRDMDSGIQEVVNIKKVIAEIKKKLREKIK